MDAHKPAAPRNRGAANTGDRRPPSTPPQDEWMLDPGDLRRQRRLMRERQRVGPLGKLVRYAVVVLVLAGAVAAYWNFDTLRGMTVDVPQLTALFSGSTGPSSGPVRPGAEPETAVVESAGVVGAAAPSSLPGKEKEAAPPEPRDAATTAVAAAVKTPEPAAETPPLAGTAAPVVVPEPPPPPPGPESFSFGGIKRVEVNEADASAAVLVVRSGDMRRASSVRWWTTDGTARAGQDYVDLGRVVLKFAPQEQNRGIHVPIIGDKTKEGPENFYVNIAWGEDEGPVERIEVVIVDDD